MVGISFDSLQICRIYSDYVIHTQFLSLPNNFTDQRFAVTIQNCNELVSFMTAQSFVCIQAF